MINSGYGGREMGYGGHKTYDDLGRDFDEYNSNLDLPAYVESWKKSQEEKRLRREARHERLKKYRLYRLFPHPFS